MLPCLACLNRIVLRFLHYLFPMFPMRSSSSINGPFGLQRHPLFFYTINVLVRPNLARLVVSVWCRGLTFSAIPKTGKDRDQMVTQPGT